jgi:L-galactose dehydrogenase
LQVGRYGQEYFDFSAERVAASVRESLARLQIPYIDIIQCHDIEFGSLDQVCRNAAVLNICLLFWGAWVC